MKKKITKDLLKMIPGGCHTYSKGYDQFPQNAPEIFIKSKGAYTYDINNKKFIDYGMGLRSVLIGHSEKEINNDIKKQIDLGNSFSKASYIELKAAKKFLSIISTADMVKFTKNGSTAVTAAIKLARAYTNKNIILRCSDHPFFSYDDWFIGSTNIKRGVPSVIQKLTKTFRYNDIEDLKNKIKNFKNDISCVVLEPSSVICPYTDNKINYCCGKLNCSVNFRGNNFLKDVQNLCKENNIVFILDEMITGFRWHYNGAQKFYDVKPDLSTFGKAMSNGFSLAAVCGKREIMELGSIEKKGKERVFLLSTTFGAEALSLASFLSTVKYLEKKNVINHIWLNGFNFKKIFNETSLELNLQDYLYSGGISCSPFYVTLDNSKKNSLYLRTLLMQEMIKNGVFLPSYVAISYRHQKEEIKLTQKALYKSFKVYKKTLNNRLFKPLKGDIIKPVFRRFN